jgi:hypothetical protein
MDLIEATTESFSGAAPAAPGREAVRRELEAILASRPFKNSLQCSGLLRYIVEHTLSGEDNLLRERVIGTEVFGRRPDYEPSEDPIVRTRASEVRKRLAQYYQAAGLTPAVLIDIPPGSYRAIFTKRAEGNAALSDVRASVIESEPLPLLPDVAPDASAVASAPSPLPSSRRALIVAATCLVIVAVVFAVMKLSSNGAQSHSKQDEFWAPLLSSREPITLCLADYTVADLDQPNWAERVAAVISGAATNSRHPAASGLPMVPFIDSIAINKLTYWLGAKGSPYVLQRSSQLTVDDLRRGPSVMVGAFDNDWSLVLLSKLRFRVQIDPKTTSEWIEDSQEPGSLKWKSPGDLPYSASSVDYAIISRIISPSTGKWLVGIGGLGMHGTEAAADLITDKQFAGLLPDVVSHADRNIQIVVKTTVINGHNSVPEIVATEVW